jgi:CRISPR system Cascade subunit CasA
LADDEPLVLQTINLISDGNATSQSPAAEVVDSFQIQASVMFDPDQLWPDRINDTILKTQEVGKAFWGYVAQIETLRNLSNHDMANQKGAGFYEALNIPFKAWLAGLTVNDERE